MTDFRPRFHRVGSETLVAPGDEKGKLHGRSQIGRDHRPVVGMGQSSHGFGLQDDLVVARYLYAFGTTIPFVRESAQIEMV